MFPDPSDDRGLTAHVILKVAGVSRSTSTHLRQVLQNSREAQVDHASAKLTMGKYREPIGTYFNFDMHGCRTDFREHRDQ
jgi:hypothetical protein